MSPKAPVTTLGNPGKCWRCDSSSVQMYRDPLLGPTDPIPVCFTCAQERHVVHVRYESLGTRLPIDRRYEPPQ